ncbi:MAG: ribosome maturation factor RimP [Thermodesulfobacteriota bacterium]
MQDPAKQIQELIQPICSSMGVDIWGIETSFSGRRGIVRIYIDSPEGVGIEQCSELSREAGTLLDVEDIIHGSYNLEVSTPGLDRTFFNPEQLKDFIGREIRITLKEPLEKRKKFTGKLVSVAGEEICILMEDNEQFSFDFQETKKVKLLFRG